MKTLIIKEKTVSIFMVVLSALLILIVLGFVYFETGLSEENFFKFVAEYFISSGYLGMGGWCLLFSSIIMSILFSLSLLPKIKLSLLLWLISFQLIIFVYANPINTILSSGIYPGSDNYYLRLKICFYFHSVCSLILGIIASVMIISIISLKEIGIFKFKPLLYIPILCFFIVVFGTILFQLYFLLLNV